MADIYFGIGIMLGLSLIAGLCAFAVGKRGWRWTVAIVAGLCAVGLVFNVAYLRHSLLPVRWLPYTNLMVLGDPDPILAAVLIGAGAALMPGSAGRRSVLLVPLAIVALWASYGWTLMSAPPVSDEWWAGVCRQTTQATCGPASAATLLATRGIRSSEAEMTRLCLTTVDGTSARGIYRGLLLKTRDTEYRPEPFFGNLDQLMALEGPTLLIVRLDAGKDVDPRYQQKWGWVPGVSHVVVMFRRRPDGRFVMGDPSVGREVWDRAALETLWHGEGIRLVKR